MADINIDFQHVQKQQDYDIDNLDALISKPSKIVIASFLGQPSDDSTVNSEPSSYYKSLTCSGYSNVIQVTCNQNMHDIGNDFTLINPDKEKNFETNIDVHSSENAGHNGKISNHNAVFQCNMFADSPEAKLSQHYGNEQDQHSVIEAVAGKGKASLFSGNKQKCVNGGPYSANQTYTYSLNQNHPETVPTVPVNDIGCRVGAKKQVLKFSNYNRRFTCDKGKDFGTVFIIHPRDLLNLIILFSVLTTSSAKCEFAGSEVLEKENNLVMVICYDHTCSGNERWDNGTTLLHLNGPNGAKLMCGKYDIVSNGSCSVLTVKEDKTKDYVQQYQFTKGTTSITISPLRRPILSVQHHDESCVDGLKYYEWNLTVKHKSEKAVFQVIEPQVDLTVNNKKIISGYYESEIHMLYRQNGNTSTKNESSDEKIATLQLIYSTRKDTDIILAKQIVDLNCKVPLILPGKTDDSSSKLVYILVPLVCIVMIVVVITVYCKWKWINERFLKFRRKGSPVDDENQLSMLNNTDVSNATTNHQNGIDVSNAKTNHQNGIDVSNATTNHQNGIDVSNATTIDVSNATTNHQHGIDVSNATTNHQNGIDLSNATTNHQNGIDVSNATTNHQNAIDVSNAKTNHQNEIDLSTYL